MGTATKKPKFKKLFNEHFEVARKETAGWKPKVDRRIEKERHMVNKFRDVSDFAEANIQTAMSVDFDHSKSLDENFAEF